MGLGGLGLILLAIMVIIYIAIGMFLNNLNKLINGKGTALAWIPICNIYLLGKLAVNKLVGWILVICVFLTGTITTTINGESTTHSILPENIKPIVSNVYDVVVLVLLIYAIIKYINLRKNAKVTIPTQPQMMPQQPVQPQMMPQTQVPQQSVQPQMMPQAQVPQQPVQPQMMPQVQVPQQPVQPQMMPQAQVSQQPMQNSGQSNNMM